MPSTPTCYAIQFQCCGHEGTKDNLLWVLRPQLFLWSLLCFGSAQGWMVYLQPAPVFIQKSVTTLHKSWGRIAVSQALRTCCDSHSPLYLDTSTMAPVQGSVWIPYTTIHINRGVLAQALRYFPRSHIKELWTLRLCWFFLMSTKPQKNIFSWVNPNHRCPSLDSLTLCEFAEFAENCESVNANAFCQEYLSHFLLYIFYHIPAHILSCWPTFANLSQVPKV